MPSAKPAPTKREPLDLRIPPTHKIHSNIRSIKMLVPRCTSDPDTGFEGCEDAPGALNSLWWKGCIAKGHDPYYSIVRQPEKRNTMEEVCGRCETPFSRHDRSNPPQPADNATPEQEAAFAAAFEVWERETHAFVPSGKHLVTGTEEFFLYVERPNTEQVQISPRVNGTLYGIDPLTWRLANGRIFPQDHPTKPVRPFCQYHNCLAGNTEVVTRRGVEKIADLAGQGVELLTEKGWIAAPVLDYGTQQTSEITFKPAYRGGPNGVWGSGTTKFRRVERATADHRWVLADGSVTESLKVGDLVRGQVNESTEFDADGFIHGFVFGDGTKEYEAKGRFGQPRYRLRVDLCVPKDEKHMDLFLVHGWYRRSDIGGNPSLVGFSDTDLKTLPVAPTAVYAAGFLRGWLAADGYQKPNGDRALGSQHPEAEGWLRRYAALAGFMLTGVSSGGSQTTNFGTRKNPLYAYSLTRADRAWRVVSVEPAGEERVYCAVVPGVHAFTLASGIYTGNCWRQDLKVFDPQYGDYCDEIAAKRIIMDYRGKAVEILNQEKIDEQMDAIRVGARG